jgi:hypothetical protein
MVQTLGWPDLTADYWGSGYSSSTFGANLAQSITDTANLNERKELTMKIANYLRLKREIIIVAAICLASPAQADLFYELQPGSTITPYNGGNPSGPSESLTGTFAWQLYTVGPGFAGFDATSLTFQSASWLLTLDTTPANDLGTSLFSDTHTSYFGEIVNRVGIPAPLLEISGSIGNYEGPLDSPTRLIYSELYLSPRSGGPALAAISFQAVQVPEPNLLALLLIGLALFAGRRLRPHFAEQTGCSEPRDCVSVSCRASLARVADPGRSANRNASPNAR